MLKIIIMKRGLQSLNIGSGVVSTRPVVIIFGGYTVDKAR